MGVFRGRAIAVMVGWISSKQDAMCIAVDVMRLVGTFSVWTLW